MSHTPLTIPDLRQKIHDGEVADPLAFLEAIMAGQDPRKLSSIYTLVQDIHDLTGGEPSEHDWAEVVDKVTELYKFRPISQTESTSAAKTLAEYLHPKRKQVEVKDIGSGGESAISRQITEEEITMFKEVFDDEF